MSIETKQFLISQKPIKDCNISTFDCGNDDLNDFLEKDALRFSTESFAKTILFTKEKDIVGYATICTDSIRLSRTERKELNKANLSLSDFPAFKIARLAVNKQFQKKGFGRHILLWTMGHIEKIAAHAARYVTVDSELESLSFYEKFDFARNLHERHNSPKRTTISLRFDLHELAST